MSDIEGKAARVAASEAGVGEFQWTRIDTNVPNLTFGCRLLSSRAKSRIERLGMARDGREGQRLSEWEASESNLSIFL